MLNLVTILTAIIIALITVWGKTAIEGLLKAICSSCFSGEEGRAKCEQISFFVTTLAAIIVVGVALTFAIGV